MSVEARLEALRKCPISSAVVLILVDVLLDKVMNSLQRISYDPQLRPFLNIKLVIDNGRADPPGLVDHGFVIDCFQSHAFESVAQLVSFATAI